MTPTPNIIDEKLFDNIYRFVALCSSADEYYFHISDGLVELDLKFLRDQLVAENKHPKQIEKQIDKRRKELKRIHENRKKFFTDFTKRFNVPPYDKLVDGYVERLNDVLQTITINDRKDAPSTTEQ